MPGLVTPPEAPPPRVAVQESSAGDQPRIRRPPSPVHKKNPSPTASRATAGMRRLSLDKVAAPSFAGGVIFDEDAALDNPDLGPFMLKLARNAVASGEGPGKALEYAIRASRSFERFGAERGLELAMSLHVAAAIYCNLERHEEAVAALERAVDVVEALPPTAAGDWAGRSAERAVAAFSGYMQLGDTHAMVGRTEKSIACYTKGLEIQIEALGESDPRVAETCRYLAEAHMQAMQFDEAERLCRRTLEIHQEYSPPASLEEASDRRLMALICEAKGDSEAALEHLVLASMAMIAHGQDADVAAVDIAIGNAYLALARFDEAVFSYQKALTVFKSNKGDTHPMVAAAFVCLADLYYKTGKFREANSYCENALRIYAKPVPGTPNEDIAWGFMEIASIYEAMNEPLEALKLLQKALSLLEDAPAQWSTVAGIEAQMGVIYYMIGSYDEARASFESAVARMRAAEERKSAFFGMLLNQMGLSCVQLFKIDEAAELFEEAKAILEQECGSSHSDTLGVYSNLAATYDAMGRVDDAIEILEHVLKVREEKIGTANTNVNDERRRLADLLKEAGRSRSRKQKSLENLLVPNSQKTKKEVTKRWSALGFKS